MGASKTGSGKTLSYLIPLIERLYVNKWNPYDGLGAIIILPTRELVDFIFLLFFNKKKKFKIKTIRQLKYLRCLIQL